MRAMLLMHSFLIDHCQGREREGEGVQGREGGGREDGGIGGEGGRGGGKK